MNILTTTGLVQKYVGDWARPRTPSSSAACALRLGAPAYPYDTLTFTGDGRVGRATASRTIDVVGAVSLGDHVTGDACGWSA